MQKTLASILSMAIMLGSFGAVKASAESDLGEPALTIIYTGEYNGSFEDTDSIIGMDIVASLFEQQKQVVPATFLLDCGDTIQGTFFSNNNEGEAAVEIMNAAHYDAMSLGNHEFDYGYERLLELASAADFPFLTQSSVFNEDEPLTHSALIERGGYKIGVFGLTTPAAKQISNAFDQDFGNPSSLIDFAKKSAKSLRESGADIVVCLSHIGNSDNFSHDYGSVLDIAESVLGIDVIIDGHSNNDITINNTNTPIVLTEGGSMVGVIEFYKNETGFSINTKELLKEDVSTIESNTKVQTVIQKWKDVSETAGKEIIGISPVTLADYEKSVIRERETAIGNLVADSIRYTAGSDVAVIHSGNIRAPLEAGEVSWIDVNNILPYSNYILKKDVRGLVIRSALEHSAALRGTENAGGFLQVSGLTYTINPELPEYERVTSITIGGKNIDDEKLYSLSVLNFIAEGGDGYSMLVDEFKDALSVGDMATSFAEYLKLHGDGIKDKLEGRIVISTDNQSVAPLTAYIIIAPVAIMSFVIILLIIKRKRSKTNAKD